LGKYRPSALRVRAQGLAIDSSYAFHVSPCVNRLCPVCLQMVQSVWGRLASGSPDVSAR